MGFDDLCQTGRDGIVVPCVALLVEDCGAATEDVSHSTGSCSAQGAGEVTELDRQCPLESGKISVQQEG